jgi:DNA-binding IclR family transcriptional regulator
LGVSGIAVPLFDSSNKVAGAVGIASLTSRVNDDLIHSIKNELISAARNITKSWGGSIPVSLDAAWSAQT